MEVDRLPAALALTRLIWPMSHSSFPDQLIPPPATAAPELSIRIESSFSNWAKQFGQQKIFATRTFPDQKPRHRLARKPAGDCKPGQATAKQHP
jgi:hypothetical protein